MVAVDVPKTVASGTTVTNTSGQKAVSALMIKVVREAENLTLNQKLMALKLLA